MNLLFKVTSKFMMNSVSTHNYIIMLGEQYFSFKDDLPIEKGSIMTTEKSKKKRCQIRYGEIHNQNQWDTPYTLWLDIYVYIYTYTHIYIYIHTHTYIYICTSKYIYHIFLICRYHLMVKYSCTGKTRVHFTSSCRDFSKNKTGFEKPTGFSPTNYVVFASKYGR